MQSAERPPSTGWCERIDAGEAQRHEAQARRLASVQAARNVRYGPGRALHRRQLLGLAARFEVLALPPGPAAHGLFARPGAFDARVRLSNGSFGLAPDRRPDVRGFAIKVLGVRGPGALGSGDTESQDFLLIQFPVTAFARSDEFVDLVVASARGPLAALAALARRHGVLGGLRRARQLAAGFAAPFSGFATERFYSALPFACGPYAARARLLPPPAERPDARARDDWAEDLARRLRARDLVYEFQLQFFVDEGVTPIEDAAVDWPEAVAPYVTVARLTLPRQSADARLQQEIESAYFDPWSALAAHRPLGEVMRARKAAYYASQQGRRN